MVDVFQQTITLLKENPTIILLFLSVAILDALALLILFYAPSAPVSIIVAPIIRAIYSDYFLHYPANFILLPKLLTHAHFFILTFFGIIITGIVVKKIEFHLQGERLTTAGALTPVIKKYFSLMIAWLITYFAFKVAMSVTMPLLPRSMVIHVAVGFMLGLVLQALLVFLIPSILISGKGLIKDLLGGFLFGVRYLYKTSLIIAVPVLLIIIFSYLKALAPFFTEFYPEAVLWILAIGIVVTMVVDLMITSSTTILYLKARNSK